MARKETKNAGNGETVPVAETASHPIHGTIPAAPEGPKKVRRLTKVIDLDAGTVTFTVKGFEPFVVRTDAYPDTIRRHAELHGVSQKIGDTVSSAKADGMTDADVLKTLQEAHADLIKGDWDVRGSGKVAEATITAEAVSRFLASRYPDEAVRADKASKLSDPAIKARVEASKEVQELAAVIRAERAAARAAKAESADDIL